MCHGNRKWTYMMIAIGVGALALTFGVNPGFLLLLAVCPLMMFVMMRSMNDSGHGAGSHDGHGCSHDKTQAEQPIDHRS